MRIAFASALAELAGRDRRVVLLTGDLGAGALEPFRDGHPDRFFNAGVAEQNMMGVATGLAEAGFLPFVYSIVTFAALRTYEFIRNGPVLQGLPVRIVGVGGGFEYGSLGPTHYGLEDLAVTRVQPGLTVLAPADAGQARAALLATWDLPGPVYYRIGKDEVTSVPGLDGRFALGRVEVLGDGADLLLLAAGSVASEAAAAARELCDRGVAAALGVVSTISPAPARDLCRLLSAFPTVLTVEAHYRSGGLGSMVAEVAADNCLRCRIVRVGVDRSPAGPSGNQAWQHRAHGLDRSSLVERAFSVLG